MISVNHVWVACLLLAAWTSGGLAMGTKGSGDVLAVTGVIRVTGNMPLPRVVLVPEGEDPDRVPKDRLYLVSGALAKELMERDQHRTVTLVGTACASPSPEYRNCIDPTEIRRTAK